MRTRVHHTRWRSHWLNKKKWYQLWKELLVLRKISARVHLLQIIQIVDRKIHQKYVPSTKSRDWPNFESISWNTHGWCPFDSLGELHKNEPKKKFGYSGKGSGRCQIKAKNCRLLTSTGKIFGAHFSPPKFSFRLKPMSQRECNLWKNVSREILRKMYKSEL